MIPRSALTIVGGLVVATSMAAQVPQQLPPGMTPEQAARMLQQRPELGSLVRQRLSQSGLSPEQIRARLRSAGYPSNMLDAYLTAATDTTTPPDPTQQMVEVMQGLGLASFSRQDSLLLTGDTLALRLLADSLRADSIALADSLAALRRGLKLFGLDVFRQPTTRFQPLVAGPVGDTYVLGPGDQLVLILTGAVELARQLTVTNAGFLVIPDVGQIYVNGLTLGQLKNLLHDRLGRVYSGVSRSPDAKTKFEVVVSNVRVQSVRVIGEVAIPGSYQLAATGTVLSALYEAGGLTERGSFRQVHVVRGQDTVATVDLYDYLLRGVAPRDVALAPGDAIFVPVRGPRVKIAGEVTRPAIYEVTPQETLRDLIAIAGGLTPQASTHAVTIDRILPPEQRQGLDRTRTVLTVNLQGLLQGTVPPVALAAGDSVTVFSLTGGRRNHVTINGAVWQPGTYELEPGMQLWDLIAMAGGLRPEAYGQRAQVLRTYADSTRRMFGVSLTDTTDGALSNPMLRERDEVTVFSRSDFRPRRYVVVSGAVRKPGIVGYADSMTMRDAVLLAGGLTDDAYLLEAELSRLREHPGDSDSLVVVLKVRLDSTFVVDETGYVQRPVGTSAAPEVVLQPFDHVFVRRQPGWEVQRNVVVTGEVRFPGRYSLVTKDERLLSVINRAGGLTPQAYANGVRFFRAAGNVGRIGIELARLLRDPTHRDNLILEAGDSVHIPAFMPTVRVEGAVNAPTSVAYVPGRGIDYYINAAGGFARNADKGGKFVQQPNGSIEKGGRPEPGAVVVVPAKDPSEQPFDWVGLFTNLAQIISATATVIIVITQTR